MSYKIGQIVFDNNGDAGAINNVPYTVGPYYTEGTKVGEYTVRGVPPELMEKVNEEYQIDASIVGISHIGIQARPGALFELNGEIIQMGRSGSYELSNDLVFIESIRPLSLDTFIFDFKYGEG